MRALLDINFLIALIDPDHIFHERAHAWWATNANQGWASCPLTENGLVRVMSSPAYSRRIQLTPAELLRLLDDFTGRTRHQFWPDELSLRDKKHFVSERIHGGQHLTDIYLLGLATLHSARLVTFDHAIPFPSYQKPDQKISSLYKWISTDSGKLPVLSLMLCLFSEFGCGLKGRQRPLACELSR